jgi:uncharacterized CHY-type Zn-finger protein
MIRNRPDVRGVNLDPQTRCEHYHGPTDIIAIKMKCCDVYYACKDCHAALADHPVAVWPQSDWTEAAVLCGSCGTEMSIERYMESGYECIECHAQFNPKCATHYRYYFQMEG